jgi:hypothetical protein
MLFKKSNRSNQSSADSSHPTKNSWAASVGLLLTMIVVGLVVGCAGTAKNPHSVPPPGSLVKLQQEANVSGDKKLYIQGGRILERAGVAVVDPYCHFTIDHVATDEAGTIHLKPDTFNITKAYRIRDLASSEYIQYAGRAGSDRTLSTIMELSGGSQPEVIRLTCSRWGMISEDGWLTIKEMRGTLAPLVEIEHERTD